MILAKEAVKQDRGPGRRPRRFAGSWRFRRKAMLRPGRRGGWAPGESRYIDRHSTA
jgi:hypothetical protein